MVRIAADENLHMVFYRDILAAALVLEPSAAVCAIVDEVLAFQMPGAGIPGFVRKAAQIAKAGIYDIRVHRDEVLLPILRHWRIFELTNLDAAAEAARTPAGRAPRQARRGGQAVRGAAGHVDRAADVDSAADLGSVVAPFLTGSGRYRWYGLDAIRRSRPSRGTHVPEASAMYLLELTGREPMVP